MVLLPEEDDAFRPLWAMKGTQSFAVGPNGVDEHGFAPLRKARSEAAAELLSRFSFNSKAARDNYTDVWENRDPWRMLQKNVSFAAPRDDLREGAPMERRDESVVVVDPFSSGALLARRAVAEGFHCIRVFSEVDSPVAKLVQEGMSLDFDATFQFDDRSGDTDAAVEDLISRLSSLPHPVAAVLAGAETGVELADMLSNRMGLLSNGEELSAARRNKYHMGETVRRANVRAVQQKLATTHEEVDAFLEAWQPDPFFAVVKPLESAGSDDVFLCDSAQDVHDAFDRINGKVNGLGGVNEGALVQEYLDGTEYVIDSVSRGGVHKVCAIWEYDKRSVNGANFVYFGMKLNAASGEREKELVDYALQVLDAMGVKYGPGHMEVKYTATGPCLVEVGTRCHGGEGTWQPIADECVGYNQIDTAFNAYLLPELWEELPLRPMHLKKSGREVFLVARQSGMLRALPGLEEIKGFGSYRRMEIAAKPRDFVYRTIDCFTRPGSVQLVHQEEEVVVKECERVRELERRGLFDFEVICPVPLPVPCVVVVDPFSSGAIIAARVLQCKMRLVMVFSEVDSPIANLVQQGTNLRPDMTIQHDSTHPDPEVAVQQTIGALLELPHPIVAIVPGAETGVELADVLSNRIGTRTNGEDLSAARRNKYLMGEAVRASGTRAAQQRMVHSHDEIDAFFREWTPSPFMAVVKPLDSAGSDGVTLCSSLKEVHDAFESIDGKVNGLGSVNEGALLMEYLDGTEYVIDSVSRDGKHKVCAIWEYDKRSVNGANFVYFGMTLKSALGQREKELVAYARNVLDAMGVEHGPGHMEVKYTATGPCLVEVGSRCHGGEGTWQPIAQECLGYNQIDAALDAYIRPDAWDALPMEPVDLKKSGREVFLVARKGGRVRALPGVDAIRQLSSFRTLEMSAQSGSIVRPTTDCFTRPGSVQLVHDSAEVVAEDYEAIRRLEEDGLFDLLPEGAPQQQQPPPPPQPQAHPTPPLKPMSPVLEVPEEEAAKGKKRRFHPVLF